MRINEIGEFGLIERIKKTIKTDGSVVKGIGDDCAVIKYTRDKYMLLTCDMLVEGVDFTLRDKPALIGRKALAVSISDIAACAGLPRYALVSLGIPSAVTPRHKGMAGVPSSTVTPRHKGMAGVPPSAVTPRFIDQLYSGMRLLARDYKVNIVGGDISRAQRLTIDVSLTGFVEKRMLVLRNGARQGDIIMVSGRLGGAACGKHLSFTPRVQEARFLARNFRIHAMIDISDGVAQDLWHIIRASAKGAVLFEALIPLSCHARDLKDALSSGEDFELLFTASTEEARKILKAKPGVFFPIGEITERKYGMRMVDKKGREKMLKPSGFRHF